MIRISKSQKEVFIFMQSVSSKEVAEMLGKRHDNFLRECRKYVSSLGDKAGEFFVDGCYTDTSNKKRFCFFITKAGCDLIANRIPMDKGIKFKEKYESLFIGEDIVSENPKEQEKKTYSIKEVAKLLGISERSVYRNIENGKLATVQKKVVTTVTAVTEGDLENFKKMRGKK